MYRVTLASLVALAAMVFLVSAQASMRISKLAGTVGPGFSITLKQGAKLVKTLKAGTYTLVITDKASFHNFTLQQTKGGHFSRMLTGTAFVGTKSATVTLRKGT